MAFGVTPSGFVLKRLEDILASLRAAQAASPAIGPSFDLSDLSPLGQLNGTHAGELAELWELGQEVFASYDPEAAEDYALTVLASLTGTKRRAATATTVAVNLSLNAGSSAPAGSKVSVSGRPDVVCTLDATVTNSGGSPAVLPGSVTCTVTGPITINAGTLTVINTPAPGWTAVTNPLDGKTGRNVDDDLTLRQRRADQLALRGGSTVSAIRADLLDAENHPELDGITEVLVLDNDTDVLDANGLPPHSFEALIDDGDVPSVADNDIAQAIWESKPTGIPSHGATTAFATDGNGDSQPVQFSRTTKKLIYYVINVQVGPTFPSDGIDQLKTELVNKGRTLRIAEDVIALQQVAAMFAVTGLINVPSFKLGFAPSPTLTADLIIAIRERATFDTSRITITVVP